MTIEDMVDVLGDEVFGEDVVKAQRRWITNRTEEIRREHGYLSRYALRLARIEWLTAQLSANVLIGSLGEQ